MIRHVNVKNVKNKRPSLLYYKTKGKTLKDIIHEQFMTLYPVPLEPEGQIASPDFGKNRLETCSIIL